MVTPGAKANTTEENSVAHLDKGIRDCVHIHTGNLLYNSPRPPETPGSYVFLWRQIVGFARSSRVAKPSTPTPDLRASQTHTWQQIAAGAAGHTSDTASTSLPPGHILNKQHTSARVAGAAPYHSSA